MNTERDEASTSNTFFEDIEATLGKKLTEQEKSKILDNDDTIDVIERIQYA